MKVVIIGGGTAGISAATTLRRRNEDCQIIILEKSAEIAIATPGLISYLAGELTSEEQLTGATVKQMADVFKIEVKLGHEVVNLNRQAKTLTITNHDPESYDKLILATGAITIRPDIKGIIRDNIFTITSFASVQKIRDYFLGTAAHKVLIVGGGGVGIEAAQAFHKLGAEVTVIEAQEHILPYFDEDMTAILQNQIRNQGIKLRINTMVDEFSERQAVLDNGTMIDYDLALIATGVKPDLRLPIMADLDIAAGGGIRVNPYLQTNDKDIYACGDNIEMTSLVSGENLRWPSASLAMKQARVIADNLTGHENKFAPIVGTSVESVFEYTAAICGLSEHQLKSDSLPYRVIHLLQDSQACFLPGAKQMSWKLLFSPQGKILGAQGVGEHGITGRLDMISEIIRRQGNYVDLAEAEMAYAPRYAAAKDAINNLGILAGQVVNGESRYAYVNEIDWDKIGNEIMLIDTRAPANFKNGHISHAVNFPLATMRDNLASIPRDRQVILYCGHGYGAYNAYCMLNQRGYDNAYMLSGSMDLYMEIALNEIYNNHAEEEMSQVWNRLQFANEDETYAQ